MPSYLTPPRATHLLVAFYELSILSLDNCLKGETNSCNKLMLIFNCSKEVLHMTNLLHDVSPDEDEYYAGGNGVPELLERGKPIWMGVYFSCIPFCIQIRMSGHP